MCNVRKSLIHIKLTNKNRGQLTLPYYLLINKPVIYGCVGVVDSSDAVPIIEWASAKMHVIFARGPSKVANFLFSALLRNKVN